MVAVIFLALSFGNLLVAIRWTCPGFLYVTTCISIVMSIGSSHIMYKFYLAGVGVPTGVIKFMAYLCGFVTVVTFIYQYVNYESAVNDCTLSDAQKAWSGFIQVSTAILMILELAALTLLLLTDCKRDYVVSHMQAADPPELMEE